MKPQAFIAVSKNRIRSYNNKHFLSDNQDYQIELYNPTRDVYLAKMNIDGDDISGNDTGIILRPGERVFLERFLNKARKFTFKTYEVGGSRQDKQAISNNGNVEVYFYKQYVPVSFHAGTIITNDWNYYPTPNIYFGGTSAPVGGTTFTTACSSVTLDNLNSDITIGNFTFSDDSISLTGNDNAKITFLSDNVNKGRKMSKKAKKSIVTGRTEAEKVSKQDFTSVSGYEWDFAPTATYRFKLLPVENKSFSVSEVKQSYCTGCGTKMKKGWKYCATCGNKA